VYREQWRPVDCVYDVSDRGRIWKGERILKQWRQNGGHYYVSMYRRAQLVAPIVARAFIPGSIGRVVKHRRGYRNNVGNLYLIEHHGEDAPACRLTESQVLEILRLSDCGVPQPTIGRMMGCARSTVSSIVTGRNWAWLTKSARESQAQGR
jgi:hypothetical protein